MLVYWNTLWIRRKEPQTERNKFKFNNALIVNSNIYCSEFYFRNVNI